MNPYTVHKTRFYASAVPAPRATWRELFEPPNADIAVTPPRRERLAVIRHHGAGYAACMQTFEDCQDLLALPALPLEHVTRARQHSQAAVGVPPTHHVREL